MRNVLSFPDITVNLGAPVGPATNPTSGIPSPLTSPTATRTEPVKSPNGIGSDLLTPVSGSVIVAERLPTTTVGFSS